LNAGLRSSDSNELVIFSKARSSSIITGDNFLGTVETLAEIMKVLKTLGIPIYYSVCRNRAFFSDPVSRMDIAPDPQLIMKY
jgi:hypothetical protein